MVAAVVFLLPFLLRGVTAPSTLQVILPIPVAPLPPPPSPYLEPNDTNDCSENKNYPNQM
jgi:hypothetical protein